MTYFDASKSGIALDTKTCEGNKNKWLNDETSQQFMGVVKLFVM